VFMAPSTALESSCQLRAQSLGARRAKFHKVKGFSANCDSRTYQWLNSALLVSSTAVQLLIWPPFSGE
jgi:hypothetical protein